MVTYFCELAGVSRSGYYEWLKASKNRKDRLKQDEEDVALIKDFFYKKRGKVGALQIKMYLENVKKVIMNHKKIRRLMKKYGLVTKVRKSNPYKKMMKATQEHRTCPNLLKRELTKVNLERYY